LRVQILSFHLLHQQVVGMVLAVAVVEMVALVVAHKIRMVVELVHQAKVITAQIQQMRQALEVAEAALEVLDQPNLL
jgi:hypothetical protein